MSDNPYIDLLQGKHEENPYKDVIKDRPPIEIIEGKPYLNVPISEPAPFDTEGVVREWEQYRPTEEYPASPDLAEAIHPVVRPFLAQGYNSVAALSRGWATMFTHMDTIAEYFESKGLGKREGLFEKIADYYEQDSERWSKRAQEVGITFMDELFSEAAGGAIPGIAEFAMGIPWASLLGAAEAKKEGEGEVQGAIVEGAKRGLLGLMFKAVHPLHQYLRAPTMGTIFGIQAATEGGEPKDIAKSVGTGALYSLTSPGGRIGLNDLKKEITGRLEKKFQVEAKEEKPSAIRKPEPVERTTKDKFVDTKPKDDVTSLEKEILDKPSAYEELRKEVKKEEQAGKVQFGAPAQPTPFAFTDPKIEESYQKSVLTKPSTVGKFKEFFVDLEHKLSREYEFLPNTREFAQLKFDLLKLAKQKATSFYYAWKDIAGILGKMKKEDYDLFSRKVVLDDLSHEATIGHSIPWGFDAATVKAELSRVNTEIRNRPDILDALSRRKIAWDSLRKEYEDACNDVGYDVSGRLKNDVYFRHQILEYTNQQGIFGTGQRLKTPTGRSFMKKRTGSDLDINRDYIQPEYQVMAQMYYDIQVARTLKAVDNNYNIADTVKKSAKQAKIEDWHDAIPVGYRTWQPREGNVFYMADSIPAGAAKAIHAQVLNQILGGPTSKGIKITPDDLRTVLAMGGKRKEWVLKNEIANTLDEIVKKRTDSWLGSGSRKVMSATKSWLLFAPRRAPKYFARNLSGDGDHTVVGNPLGFSHTPHATKELYDVLVNKKEMTPDMKDWFDRGGAFSTLQVQELDALKDLWAFRRLYENEYKGNVPSRIWKKYWHSIGISNELREGILRYGNYLSYLEQMKKNKDGRPNNFGASRPDEIMALKDIKDRAYWLSNDLIGAYDRVSVMGQNLRSYIYPFWSWKEVNFKWYIQAAKNAASDGTLTSAIGKKMLGTAVRTPLLAARVGSFVLKATVLASVLHVWNNTRFPELEESLSDEDKAQTHIIFGKDEDGNILYFNRLGALDDFLEWFGLDDSPHVVDALLKGEMTIGEIADKMWKSPINVIAQGITPLIKIPFEMATRRTVFPNLFKTGTIRDRGVYIARFLSMEPEYSTLIGLPSRGYEDSLKNFVLYSKSPGEGAYRDIQDLKRKWLTDQGKGYEGFWLTPKGNSLYNLKLALRYGDEEAYVKYGEEYMMSGGTAKSMFESLNSMSPLAGMSRSDSLKFVESLTTSELKKLEWANEFYINTLRGGEK